MEKIRKKYRVFKKDSEISQIEAGFIGSVKNYRNKFVDSSIIDARVAVAEDLITNHNLTVKQRTWMEDKLKIYREKKAAIEYQASLKLKRKENKTEQNFEKILDGLIMKRRKQKGSNPTNNEILDLIENLDDWDIEEEV